MKTLKFLLCLALVALGFLGAAPRTALARGSVSFEFFYNSLDPYGEWVDVADYGYCWHPTGVEEGWSPYTDGYWAYTDDGWTWVSYEDWGGITYHYGRWVSLEDEGWVWVPDYEWAPAWVSWRHSDDYVGWAPLPPRARFNRHVGISVWVDSEYDIGPGYYSFCSVRDFGAPALRPVIIDRSQNVTIINRTVNITNITVRGDNNTVYVGGPRYETLAARTARPIPTLKLVRQTDPAAIRAAGGRTLARQEGNQLTVIAPQVAPPAGKVRPNRIARTIAQPKVEHGWAAVKDPQARQQLQAQIKEQTKGLTPAKAPAKPVAPADIKAVEQRIAAAKAGAKSSPAAGASPASGTTAAGVSPEVTQPSTTPAATAKAARGKKGQPLSAAQPNPAAVSPADAAAAGQASPAGAGAAPNAKAAKGPRAARAAALAAQPSPTAASSPAAAARNRKGVKGETKLQPFTATTEQQAPDSGAAATPQSNAVKHGRNAANAAAQAAPPTVDRAQILEQRRAAAQAQAQKAAEARDQAAQARQQRLEQQREQTQTAAAERARRQAELQQQQTQQRQQQLERARQAQAERAQAAQPALAERRQQLLEQQQAQRRAAAAAAAQQAQRAQAAQGQPAPQPPGKKKTKQQLEQEEQLLR